MQDTVKKRIHFIVSAVTLFAVCIPLLAGYIVNSGDVTYWIQKWGMDGAHKELWYILLMIAVHLVTLIGTELFFRNCFTEEGAAVFGVVFYMTCPYRMDLCYYSADLGEVIAWMILPYFLWGMIQLYREKKVGAIVASVALISLAYINTEIFLVAVVLAAISAVWYRRAKGLAVCALGLVAGMPALWFLEQPTETVITEGYLFKEYFSCYFFPIGKPGLGLGLLAAVLLVTWYCYVMPDYRLDKKYGFFLGLAIMMFLLAWIYCPWKPFADMAVFFGIGCILLCIPTAFIMGEFTKLKSKFLSLGVPFMVLTAAIGIAVYMSNMLLYHYQAV